MNVSCCRSYYSPYVCESTYNPCSPCYPSRSTICKPVCNYTCEPCPPRKRSVKISDFSPSSAGVASSSTKKPNGSAKDRNKNRNPKGSGRHKGNRPGTTGHGSAAGVIDSRGMPAGGAAGGVGGGVGTGGVGGGMGNGMGGPGGFGNGMGGPGNFGNGMGGPGGLGNGMGGPGGLGNGMGGPGGLGNGMGGPGGFGNGMGGPGSFGGGMGGPGSYGNGMGGPGGFGNGPGGGGAFGNGPGGGGAFGNGPGGGGGFGYGMLPPCHPGYSAMINAYQNSNTPQSRPPRHNTCTPRSGGCTPRTNYGVSRNNFGIGSSSQFGAYRSENYVSNGYGTGSSFGCGCGPGSQYAGNGYGARTLGVGVSYGGQYAPEASFGGGYGAMQNPYNVQDTFTESDYYANRYNRPSISSYDPRFSMGTNQRGSYYNGLRSQNMSSVFGRDTYGFETTQKMSTLSKLCTTCRIKKQMTYSCVDTMNPYTLRNYLFGNSR